MRGIHAVIVAGLALACGSSSTSPSFGHLELSVVAATEAVELSPIEMELRVVNPTGVTQQISLNPSVAFVPRVTDENGLLVWERSDTGDLSMTREPYSIQPGETMSLRYTWNLRDRSGRPVTPGVYNVRAFLLVEGATLGPSNAISFTVLPRSN